MQTGIICRKALCSSLLLVVLSAWAWPPASVRHVFATETGRVHFRSAAPLELIEAWSNQLRGVIDVEKRTFAFAVDIRTFEGFNSALQREHFNENYMESNRFPRATFTGKIIEQVDLSQEGEWVVRAKGKLVIHGVEQERIIRSRVVRRGDELEVSSFFTVLLAEHDIEVPKIVNQKIASEIEVRVDAVLREQSL
ncbi:MAG: YceI family protein [Bacteroidetes bacterium]|nr:MAG: YceI family protein [Bacteroidota bacterium]